MKKTLIFLCISLFTIVAIAQKSYRDKFVEANYLMEENNYSVALPIWEELYQGNENNANINYNLGVCMLNSTNNKVKAESISYLLVAAENVATNYDPYSTSEKSAPVYAYYYLGIAQHLNYKFDEAIVSFEKFDKEITSKNYLYDNNKRRIEQAKYAKYSVAHPVNIEVTNLGGQMNSQYPDYSPVVRIDESAIYFTSRRLLEDSSNQYLKDFNDAMYYEDIYVSYNDDGEWGMPERLNINTTGHEATINLSIDGRTLYIYKDDNGDGNLYYSKLESDSAGHEIWADPVKFGSNINSDAYETHVAITPDGKRLYYVSDREGGYGGKDIYFCNLLPTGNWAAPQNAGPQINTSGDEDGVFIHPDGVTMYFSSNGHSSIGGYDIFNVEYIEDSNKWAKPKNLGYPINSVDDDVFFVTTPDGKRGYFSSFKEKGYGDKDIYMIQLFDAKETGLTLYTGEFTFIDRMTPPEGALVTIIDNTTGTLVGYYSPRQRDGKFSAILRPNTSYHLVYEADEYQSYEEDIFVPDGSMYQEIYKAIRLKPVRVGKKGEIIVGEKENIKGVISVDGAKKSGVSIDLLSMDKNLLNSSTTDDAGIFNFAALDPDSVYFIRINTEDPEVLKKNQIVIMNEQGEELLFKKIGEGLYQFSPKKAAEKATYTTDISGVATKNGMPLKKVNVKLFDKEDDLIAYTETDNAGVFNFSKLNSNERYLIVFDVDKEQLPDENDISIVNEKGEILVFRKIREGEFEFIPDNIRTTVSKEATIQGAIASNGEPLRGVSIDLLDDQQSLLSSSTTDDAGVFNFYKLDPSKKYLIRINAPDDQLPTDDNIIIKNKDGKPLNFKKVGKGLYEFVPEADKTPVYVTNVGGLLTINNKPVNGANVRLLNDKQSLLASATTDQVGAFNFYNLSTDKQYFVQFDAIDGEYPIESQILLTNADGEPMVLNKVKDGLYVFTPTVKKNIGLIYSVGPNGERIYSTKSYSIEAREGIKYDESYPTPAELEGVIVYFQKFFTYNVKDISENNQQFLMFANDIAELVRQRGYADIIITSSASKVPTRTWKNNTVVSSKRAYDTKALLERVMLKRGLKPSQYNFVDINTLITGPEYKGDYLTNKKVYEKFQYVRVFVK